MHITTRIAYKARNRIFFNLFLENLAIAILTAVMVAITFIAIQRLLFIPLPYWLYIVIYSAVFAASIVLTVLRRPSINIAAERLDIALKLKDRISSALYAAELPDNPLARAVIADAAQTASNIKIHHAIPIRPGRKWAYLPPALALAVATHFLLPQMDLAGLAHARDLHRQQQADAQTAQEQLAKTVTAIEKITADQPTSNPQDQQQLLDQLAQLTQQDLTDPEKRQAAAQQLSQAQDQLAQRALDQEQALRPLENALTRLDPGQSGPADAFTDALRRGDYDDAQQALQDLTAKIESMPESDRQSLAQQLENLTQQLQDAADNQQQLADQASQQADHALQDAGLSQDQIDQLKQLANNPQALQQQLQQQGMSPQDAENLAQQLSQAQRNTHNTDQSQQSTKALSKALQQMQQAARNQQDQGEQGQSQSFQRAADGAGDQLSEIARMREQLSQIRRAQSQAQQSLNQLSQGSQGNQQTQQSQGGGIGGQQAGTSEGGNPLGQHKNPGPYNTQAADDIRQGDGRIITSWLDQSPAPAGEPTIEYNQAVTEARQNAEKAVTEDRVPNRYHQSIRQYFNQIPDSSDKIQSPPPVPH